MMSKAEKYLAKFKRAEAKCKPCPFCGGQPNIYPTESATKLKGYLVRCSDCNLNMTVYTRFIVQATHNWNRRSNGNLETN